MLGFGSSVALARAVDGTGPTLRALAADEAPHISHPRREAILHRMQQLVHERAMFTPIYDLAFIVGVGRRVEETGLGLIAGYAFSGPMRT